MSTRPAYERGAAPGRGTERLRPARSGFEDPLRVVRRFAYARSGLTWLTMSRRGLCSAPSPSGRRFDPDRRPVASLAVRHRRQHLPVSTDGRGGGAPSRMARLGATASRRQYRTPHPSTTSTWSLTMLAKAAGADPRDAPARGGLSSFHTRRPPACSGFPSARVASRVAHGRQATHQAARARSVGEDEAMSDKRRRSAARGAGAHQGCGASRTQCGTRSPLRRHHIARQPQPSGAPAAPRRTPHGVSQSSPPWPLRSWLSSSSPYTGPIRPARASVIRPSTSRVACNRRHETTP